jgi:hypothetical protein
MRWVGIPCLYEGGSNVKNVSKAVIVMIALASPGCFAQHPPETFVKTFDEPGTWKSVEVREELSKDALWRALVDGLSQSFDLEVLDKESGYIRTSWKYNYVILDRVTDRYRSRMIVKCRDENWGTIQVKCEANWLEGDRGWIVGYDTRLLEDVYGDLQGRVGRSRR